MGVPTAADVFDLLEGYCASDLTTLARTGNLSLSSAVITGINTDGLKKYMRIAGTGIPAGSTILSVDILDTINGQITVSAAATAPGTAVALTITTYAWLSEKWVVDYRDQFVIPWIEGKIRMSLRTTSSITEYVSGTGSEIIVLSRRPINSVTTIKYVSDGENVSNLLQSVELLSEEGMIRSKTRYSESVVTSRVFARGNKNIKVEYVYGFTDLAGADDIGYAIKALCAKRVLNHVGAATGGGSVSVQAYSRQYGQRGKYTDVMNELDKEAYQILKKYWTGVV